MSKSLEEMQALGPEEQKALFDRLAGLRHKGKTTVYSSVYGVGAVKLARELKIPVAEAKKLLEAYWEINWAIKACAADQTIKNINGQMWLYNPLSKFWYSLRYEKDVWSTLIQGSGVYCFDTWLAKVLAKRKQLTASFHDEIVIMVKKGNREKCNALLQEAIKETNDKLKLNTTLGIGIQYGHRYSECH